MSFSCGVFINFMILLSYEHVNIYFSVTCMIKSMHMQEAVVLNNKSHKTLFLSEYTHNYIYIV